MLRMSKYFNPKMLWKLSLILFLQVITLVRAGVKTAGRMRIPSDWLGRSAVDDNITTTEAPTPKPLEIKEGLQCLNNAGLKFTTIDLHPETNRSSSSGKIRINKFYGVKRDRFYVRNSGRGTMSIRLQRNGTSLARIRICKDPEYNLRQIEVFWTLNNNYGAQHAIEGQPHALEIQLVHFEMGKATKEVLSDNAKIKPVVVVSIIFEVQGHDNPAVESISRAAISAGFPHRAWRQVHGVLDIKKLFPSNLEYYYYESGNFIGEPCSNNVKYYVFREVVPISYRQLDRIRMIRDYKRNLNEGVFFLKDNKTMHHKRAILSKKTVKLVIVNHESLGTGTSIYPKLFSSIFPVLLVVHHVA